MSRPALKPCPFCGSSGEELMMFCDPDEGRDNSGPSRRIQCGVCHIEAPYYPSKAEAVAAWNNRSVPPGFSIAHKDEIHAPSVERINARAEQVMLAVVNEWHRQVGIDEILKSKLTKRIADTVATGVFAAALRELMKEVGR